MFGFNMFTLPNSFQPFMQMPVIGPWRQYSLLWNEMAQRSFEFSKSAAEFSGEMPTFFQMFSKNLPGFWREMANSAQPLTLMTGINEYLRFLDRNWEDLMRSESYSQKSAAFTEQRINLARTLNELHDLWLESLALVSKRQLGSLTQEIAELKNSFDALQQKMA